MSGVYEVSTKEALEEHARMLGTRARFVGETWDHLRYEVWGEREGAPVCLRYVYRFPPDAARRRLARTYAVGMVHRVGTACCHHVREVLMPQAVPDGACMEYAALIAAACTEVERFHVCGASVETLAVYRAASVAEWTVPTG